jgi:hypothetical protein
MIITNPETGASHDEPLCRGGCGGFEAIQNPLCVHPEVHGTENADKVMRRICAAVGHVLGTNVCLRCKDAT